MTVTVPELKAHLRLNDGSEDDQLADFIAVAETTFSNLTGRTLDDDADTGFPDGVPAPVKLAVKLLSSHFYSVREAFSEDRLEAMPFGFVSVCRQYATRYVGPGAA
ncbi:MAG: head-tail connector protein [Gemmataceae bacterium]|nr:head-tail connector protein [Gemmataceae bacterium]